jgi:diacylglycerol kinase family enzyme
MLARRSKVAQGEAVLAILNANARQTTDRTARELRLALPAADVVVTRSLEEAAEALDTHRADRRELLLSGGGDGTVTSLVNMLAEGRRPGTIGPPVGVLRLGTGNGLGNVLGAGSFTETMARLPRMPLPPPTVHFDLVNVEGKRSHFAGTGWDARILADYQRNYVDRTGLARRVHESLFGYLWALGKYTVPEEHAILREKGQAEVEVTNLGPPAYTVDAAGKVKPLPRGETGAILYRGPTSVATCVASPEWGFRFRAHPHARKKAGWLNVRVYDRPVLEAVRNMHRLWRGVHPQPGMHDFFVQRVRMRFSRPVPFQIGGDPQGMRDEIHYDLADSGVDLVDWQAPF